MKENEQTEVEGNKLLKVYMFPIEGNHDSSGMGINCPDPRERKPLALYHCVALCCCFGRGAFRDKSKNDYILCAWEQDKTVEENMNNKDRALPKVIK